jgi:hypothetical protein
MDGRMKTGLSEPQSVTEAYHRIASHWEASRGSANANELPERRLIDRLNAPLSPGASILDAGCGCVGLGWRISLNAGFELPVWTARRE